VVLTDVVHVGEDAAGGGTDLDAEREYNLGFALAASLEHAQQGYHVKVTVDAPGSRGAAKQKVFWVDGCNHAPPPPPPFSL
jgi:hypothetical protein